MVAPPAVPVEPQPEQVADESEPVEEPAADIEAEPLVEPAVDPEPTPSVEPVDPELDALEASLAEESTDATDGPDTESLDDIAPATTHVAEEAAKSIDLPDDRVGIPLWPFWVYLGLWAVLVGLAVWQFMQVPAGSPISEVRIYSMTVLGGLVMTALGPLLALTVWLAVWLNRPGRRTGLFSRVFIVGAASTLAGVAMWWVALMAVDMARLGRFF